MSLSFSSCDTPIAGTVLRCTRRPGHTGAHRCNSAGVDGPTYRSHLEAEGRGPVNENPDGCFYCGSMHHHTSDCPELQ